MDESPRFRRALKNPIVMVGLCLLAGIAIDHNVIGSPLDSPLSVSVASMPVPPATELAALPPSSVAHDDVATLWILHPARDPFAPMTVTNKWSKRSSKHSTTSASPNPKRYSGSSNTLLLKAVAIESQQRSAVINRQVVDEGEMIDGYQVVSIQLKGVWLKRHGRKKL